MAESWGMVALLSDIFAVDVIVGSGEKSKSVVLFW
jgi:hypothetical protein